MILRVFTLLIAFSSATFASNNPFVDKFGGPYTSADVEFRKDMMRYAVTLNEVFIQLGYVGFKTKRDFAEYREKAGDRQIDQLNPKTKDEELMKASAIYVRNIFGSIADPTSVGPEASKDIKAFIEACVPPTEKKSTENCLRYVLIRFQEFIMGMPYEELPDYIKSRS